MKQQPLIRKGTTMATKPKRAKKPSTKKFVNTLSKIANRQEPSLDDLQALWEFCKPRKK